MAHSPEEMWDLMAAGSEDLRAELELDDFKPPRVLDAIDRWIADQGGTPDDDDVARLGLLLARVLIEAHGGGLSVIREKEHPLAGEWAVTGFQRGLDADYHVPFVVSAVRIALDRSLTAREWYAGVVREGR
jgi:hypothetical protein